MSDRDDAIQRISEHVDHALREIEKARWKMDDAGCDPALRKKADTIISKLVYLIYDLA